MKLRQLKLTIDHIPANNWGENLHHYLEQEIWDSVRREVYAEFGYRCAACEVTNVRFHCHEAWKFNDKKCIQKLDGFLCLCEDCHNIKHWGRTVAVVNRGQMPHSYLEKLKRHFCEVNNCAIEVFEEHRYQAGELWQKRSRKKYKLDWGKFSPERIEDEWLKLQKKKKRGTI